VWHERQRTGLGKRFLDELDLAVERVGERAESFPQVHKQMRRAQLDVFKYGIFFLVIREEVVVLDVIDLRRDPQIWQSRAP
jgi:hypothetical protein